MKKMIIILLLCCMCFSLNSLFASELPTTQDLMKMSQEERQAIFRELPRLIEEHEKLKKRYEIDPLLKQAYEMYIDYENRDREEVISLFEKYIEKEPDSVFLPEIYYRMGNMFAGNANYKKGEAISFNRMREYFLKAHEAYGGKYSPESFIVYYNLTFMPGTLETRLQFYDWLLAIQNGTVDNFYNIRNIGNCVNGLFPEYTQKQLEDHYEHTIKRNLPLMISSVEERIFHDSFQPNRDPYMDLSTIARLYPDTELGRQAQYQIDRADAGLGISSEALELAITEPPTNIDIEEREPVQQQDLTAIETIIADDKDAPVKTSSYVGRRLPIVAKGSIAIVLATMCIFFIIKRRKKYSM